MPRSASAAIASMQKVSAPPAAAPAMTCRIFMAACRQASGAPSAGSSTVALKRRESACPRGVHPHSGARSTRTLSMFTRSADRRSRRHVLGRHAGGCYPRRMGVSGIAGVMTRNGDAAPGRLLRAMGAALTHRGPDGEGHYRSGDVGMVQMRLAIIDLATGDQPLYEPGGAALVANAEIYNYLELRRDFPDSSFATQSDCELPLHLYRRHVLDFTSHLRGMYAIALHDPAAGRLVLARDPFGIKPLYYAETPQYFAFPSEPQAPLQAGILDCELAAPPRNELLQMQFTTGRDTIFAGIKRVLPGETIVVRQGRVVERRRQEILPQGGPVAIDEDEALARLDTALADSGLVHQRSDVPFGMFLSGGID